MITKEKETEILRDIYKFLNDYSNCPPMISEDSDRYWSKVGERMTSLFQKYQADDTCKLCETMCITVFQYLEYKAYRKMGEKNGQVNV